MLCCVLSEARIILDVSLRSRNRVDCKYTSSVLYHNKLQFTFPSLGDHQGLDGIPVGGAFLLNYFDRTFHFPLSPFPSLGITWRHCAVYYPDSMHCRIFQLI